MRPSRLVPAHFARRNPSPITSSNRLPAFLSALSASCHRRTSTNDGTLPLSSSPSAITDLLSSFCRAGLLSEARHLLLSLKSPTAFHYNTVIHSLAVSNHSSDALRLFDDMRSRGVAPNVASFTILVLDEMIGRKCTPNINAFTSILRAYCMKGMIGDAKRLIFLMEKNGFVPDTIIYSVLIEGLCRVGEFDEVERILGGCDLKGWKPNEVTYNSYMNGLCKWGRVDEAFRQLEAMQSRGLYPDNVTLGILFDCLCRDDSKLCAAKYLLERNFELGWYVDVYFYNSLMNRLCETGNWSSVLKLLTDMVKKGIDPDTCTFTISRV
ncbi:putative tetratricopeptide-like helical domain superfamily [Dioscorea sansibarensis]